MRTFGTFNYAVVIGYLCIIAGIGASFYRRKATAREYFLGGRSMSWLPVGISIFAADMSAISLMGTPAWSYKHNLEMLMMSLTYPLVVPVVILVFLPFYSKLDLYTAYEYLEKRFDVSVRVVASIMFQILRVAHVSLAIYAPSLIISLVTGLPVWQCPIFMGLFTTLYTTLGGMKAVIWTDGIQFSMAVTGLGLIFYIATIRGSGGLVSAYQTAFDAGRLKVLNLSTDPNELTSLSSCLIGGFVLCLGPLTTDQAVLQRLFTTKSREEAKRSLILQAIIGIPTNVLLYSVGIVIFVFYHFHASQLAGLTSEDAIVPFFVVNELPNGISGLIVASIFAASMAVMSAGINALTTAKTVDIYQRLFRPNEAPQHYARVGRIGTAFWGLTGTILALFAGHLGELVNAYSRVRSYLVGPFLGIFLLGMLSKRVRGGAALFGAVVGFLVVAWVGINTGWTFFYRGPIGLVVTLIVAHFASLLMQPAPPEKTRGLVIGQGAATPASI